MRNKTFCDLFPPTDIDQNRLKELEDIVADSSKILCNYHSLSKIKTKKKFYSSFLSNYSKNKDIIIEEVYITEKVCSSIYRLKEVEYELLSGFSRLIEKLIIDAAIKYNKDSTELHAEAYGSFVSALLNYNASVKFCTYLYVSISQNLRKFCEKERMAKVPLEIVNSAAKVKRLMRSEHLSFDEAIEKMKISEKKKMKIVRSFTKINTATDLAMENSDFSKIEQKESFDWVLEIVNTVDLGTLEKAVLNAFLEAPQNRLGLAKGCRDLTNPNTGQPYSNTALSKAWKRVKNKIGAALSRVA